MIKYAKNPRKTFLKEILICFLSQEVSDYWFSHTDYCVCIKRQIFLMMFNYLHQQVCPSNN